MNPSEWSTLKGLSEKDFPSITTQSCLLLKTEDDKSSQKLRKDLSLWKQLLSQILSNTLYNIKCQRPTVAPSHIKSSSRSMSHNCQKICSHTRIENVIKKHVSSQVYWKCNNSKKSYEVVFHSHTPPNIFSLDIIFPLISTPGTY